MVDIEHKLLFLVVECFLSARFGRTYHKYTFYLGVHLYIYNMNDSNNIKRVIKAIASHPLFMQRQEALNLAFKYDAILNSGILANDKLLEIHQEKMEALTAVQFHSASKSVVTGKLGGDFENVPNGSVAVIPVMGVMSRDSYCSLQNGFVTGTRDLEKTVEMLDLNENVEGIVFYINTPGGQASGNESLSKKIQACKTPTVGLYEMMASAGVGAFQGVDELYAVESSSVWGSIGTYISFYDDKRLLDEMGIDIYEIYAPQSTEKNKTFREAIEGNEEPMKEYLAKMTDNFIKQVKKARPNLKDDGKVFKGEEYNAMEAKKIGAIDGIKDLNQAIERARYLFRNGKQKRKSAATKNLSIMSEDNAKAGFWERMFGSKNAEQAEKSVEQVNKEMVDLKESNQNLTNQLQENQQSLEKVNAENKELQAALDAAKAQNEKHLETIATLEDATKAALEGTEFENVQQLADDHKKVIAHNIELGGREAAATPVGDQQDISHTVSNTLEKPMTAREKVDQQLAQIEKEEKEKAGEKAEK